MSRIRISAKSTPTKKQPLLSTKTSNKKTRSKRKPKKVKVRKEWQGKTVKELQELYPELGLNRYTLEAWVKQGRVKSTKIDTKKMYCLQDVKNHIENMGRIGEVTRKKEKDTTPVKSYLELLRNKQTFYGGSTHTAKWVSGTEPVKWGTEPEHTTVKSNVFMDTLIVAIPLYVTFLYTGTDRPAFNPKDISEQTELIRERLFKNLLDCNKYGGDLHGLVILNVTKKDDLKGFVLSATNPPEALKIPRFGTVSTPDWIEQGETYLAYQSYRYSVSDVNFTQMVELVKKLQEGTTKNPYLETAHPILATRYDITTNLPGAVMPLYTQPDLIEYGLEYKTNSHYTGNKSHTFIAIRQPEPEQPESGETGEPEPENLEQYAPSSKSEFIATLGTIPPDLTDLLLVENLGQQELLEVKIYDKLAYSLEKGNVASSITGKRSLQNNLINSTKGEINTAFKNLSERGISRIETRIRGRALKVPITQQIAIHADYARILCCKFSIITPFQYSINSFMDTIQATVAIIIETPDNVPNWYGVAHWANNLSKQTQGVTTCSTEGENKPGMQEVDFNNWISYQSNRHVPVVILEYKEIDKTRNKKEEIQRHGGYLKFVRATVLPATSKGYSNIICIMEPDNLGEGKRPISTSKKAGLPFSGFIMPPFVSANINAPARSGTPSEYTPQGEWQSEPSGNIARKVKELLNRFNRKQKKDTQEQLSEWEEVYTLVLKHIKEGKPVSKFVLAQTATAQETGYLFAIEDKHYIANYRKKAGIGVVVKEVPKKLQINNQLLNKKVAISCTVVRGIRKYTIKPA